MAWYRNHYHCGDCGTDWEDEWSCCCDDECPVCGSRNWSPVESDDLTETVQRVGESFAILRSAITAEDKPRYETVALFHSEDSAMRFLAEDGTEILPAPSSLF